MQYKDHLESDRLITRFLTMADAPAWVEYCSDPVATRFTAVPDKTPEEMSQFLFEVTMKRYAENRLGAQALILKDTGEFIGKCGLFLQELNGEPVIEIGYHLLRRFWGKGYASEAARLFRDYCFENKFADSICSIIDPQNVPSQNVALRNGMKLVDTNTEFRGNYYHLYRISREEWELLKKG